MRRSRLWCAVALVAATSSTFDTTAHCGEDPVKEVDELVAELRSPDADTRRSAAQALGKMGAPAKAALPALTAALSDAKSGIRREAIAAVSAIGIACSRGASAQPRNPDAPRANKRTESAVMWALRWLKNHQAASGAWDCAAFDAMCKLNRCGGPGEAAYVPGVTGLALSAFLGAGETHRRGASQETVKKGLEYLLSIQDADGCFGPRTDRRFLYNHACAALPLIEAYGMTSTKSFKAPAQRAVGFVLKAKNPYLAWRYGVPPDGESDTSVTGWMVAVLKSAQMSELEVDKSALADAVSWVEKMTDPATGRTGYRQRGGAPEREKAASAKFPAERIESPTAVGMFVRLFADRTLKDDPMMDKGADVIAKKLPRWDEADGSIDFSYWYHGSLVMFQVGGPRWKAWNDALTTALIPHQNMLADRDERGSWDPVDVWSPQGGRIYATAVNCLTLEVYYRYGRLKGMVVDPNGMDTPQREDKPPVMSESLRAAVAALTDAAKCDDADVRSAAQTALDRLHAAYPAPPADKK